MSNSTSGEQHLTPSSSEGTDDEHQDEEAPDAASPPPLGPGSAIFRLRRDGVCLSAHTAGGPWPPAARVVGQRFGDWLPGRVATQLLDALQKALDEGKARELSFPVGSGEDDGEQAVHIYPMDGEATVIVGPADQRAPPAAGQAGPAPQPAPPMDPKLPSLLGAVSRDLREPVRSIHTGIQLLSRQQATNLDEDGRDQLDDLRQGADKLYRQIGDLVEYLRAQEGPRASVEVDLEVLLDRIERSMDARLRADGAVLTRDALPTIDGDPSQVQLLFENLISTALDRAGDQAPHIHITGEDQGEAWRVTVEDNGEPIPPEQQENLFLALHERRDPDAPGPGPGLAICRALVEGHGGEISLESGEDGTQVVFTLPKEPPEDA